jgi:hypothetical protein
MCGDAVSSVGHVCTDFGRAVHEFRDKGGQDLLGPGERALGADEPVGLLQRRVAPKGPRVHLSRAMSVSVVRYDGTYSDARGREVIALLNDGDTLRTTIRDIEFSGPDFDGMTPVDDSINLAEFTLHHSELCACLFAFDISIPVIIQGSEVSGILYVDLELGAPTPNGGIDRERLGLSLEYGEHRVGSSGGNGYFEDAFAEIARQLPQSVFIKACINCLFSDYSPLGHGLYGGMMCFRNIKAEYLQVKSKRDFFSVLGRQDRFVQETYLCSEFSRRIPGTGYRG